MKLWQNYFEIASLGKNIRQSKIGGWPGNTAKIGHTKENMLIYEEEEK